MGDIDEGRRSGRRSYRLERLGQPEVEHLHGAVWTYLHVRGLQVAVDDALFVSGLERLENLPGDGKCFGNREPSLDEAIGERRPLDQLHHQSHVAVGVLHSVDGSDVRVVERRESPGLPLEAGHVIGVRQRIGDHFDRHVPSQLRVACAVDASHATLADLGGDLIDAAASARNQAHGTSGARTRSARILLP